MCNHESNVPSRLSPQWLCGITHALGYMMCDYRLLVPMYQRVLNKLNKVPNINGH